MSERRHGCSERGRAARLTPKDRAGIGRQCSVPRGPGLQRQGVHLRGVLKQPSADGFDGRRHRRQDWRCEKAQCSASSQTVHWFGSRHQPGRARGAAIHRRVEVRYGDQGMVGAASIRPLRPNSCPSILFNSNEFSYNYLILLYFIKLEKPGSLRLRKKCPDEVCHLAWCDTDAASCH